MPRRLGGQANTYPLSPVFAQSAAGWANRVERYRKRRLTGSSASFLLRSSSPAHLHMQLFELTRALVDTESITGNEERVGLQLLDYVSPLAARYGGRAELW